MADSLSLALITAARHRTYPPDELTEMVRDFIPADDPDRGERLWIVAGELASYRQRLAAAEEAIRKEREADVRANGAVRFADTFITTTPASARTTTPGLAAWIAQTETELGEPQLAHVFRLDGKNLRVTALRALAERLYYHQNPGAEPEAAEEYARTIENTFAPVEYLDPRLAEKPINRAPKWAATLHHGQRAGSFTNKKTVSPDE